MLPSFIAFLNKAGVACAADTSATVYHLAEGKPVGIAVNPYSPIPWEKIISTYKVTGCYKDEDSLEGYFNQIDALIKELPASKEYSGTTQGDNVFIVIGYGKDDLYPSQITAAVAVNDEGACHAEILQRKEVTNKSPFCFCTIGCFESMSPILYGASGAMRAFVENQYESMFEMYKQKILEKHSGAADEREIRERLAEFEIGGYLAGVMEQADMLINDRLELGIQTFSIEGMVDAVETIINTNARLDRLKEGGRCLQRRMKELAVITKPEGMKWLVHDLYAI